MEKDLKAIKNSITIVSGDKEINELIMEYMQKPYDCFGRAYKEGHPECRQCVIIAEFKDFQTGEFRRDPLWVACLETCRFLTEQKPTDGKINDTEEVEKEMETEMQTEKLEKEMEETETESLLTKELIDESFQESDESITGVLKPIEEKPIEKPRRASIIEGHTKTLYRRCSKCGEKKSMYESTYNNAIRKYGSLEEMNKQYLCRKCR